MPALVDMSMVGTDQQRVLLEVQFGQDLRQVCIRVCSCLSGFCAQCPIHMLYVIHLVDVDQHQLVGRVVQPGQGGIHHVQVGGFVLPGGEEPGVQVSRGDQLLKPVVTRGSRLYPQPAGGGENVVLRHGWDDFIVQVHGGHIAQVVPGTGHQHPVTGRGEGWYTAVNGGGSPLIF